MFFNTVSSSFNPYRLTADAIHVLSICILLCKFWRTKSSIGVSGRSQILLAATYTLRYADLWLCWIWVSYYNTLLKVFYIFISFLIVYLTYFVFRKSFQWEHDTFRIEMLIIPVTVLAYFVNHQPNPLEISWTWSIYMEAVALVPQLFMIWKAGNVDSYMVLYLMFMGCYRGLYIFNWVYRYYKDGYYDIISATSGVIETTVGLFGVLSVISLKLGRMSGMSPSRTSPSIYVLPSVTEHFGKEYEILKGDQSSDEKDKIAKVHISMANPNYTGVIHT